MENWGLSEWLHWQETLNPRKIDLNLNRIGIVASRLDILPPVNRTFLIAGTNGKGTTLALIEDILIQKFLWIILGLKSSQKSKTYFVCHIYKQKFL